MLTLATELKNDRWSIISALPERIRNMMSSVEWGSIYEIRLRQGMPLALTGEDGTYYISSKGRVTKDCREGYIVTEKDISRGMELITRSSVYAHQEEIIKGYVTLSGGHRVGVCGDVAGDHDKIYAMRRIHSLNYRFAREIIGCADGVINDILTADGIKNTLIASPPMCGKTTLLRDIARSLSVSGKRVSVVDERREIAACIDGVPAFDLGANCDVLSGAPKVEGMMLMLRSMSPEVIITDEIGTKEDFDAIREIKKRGVKVITTIHANSGDFPDFDKVIFLNGVGKCSKS